jgi:hypothetical protein
MPLPTLTLAPDQASYSAGTAENEILSVKLDGGFSRYRRDILKSSFSVSVQWSVGPTEYSYLRAFYRNSINSGLNAFYINLIIDGPALDVYEAHFVPGSFSLQSINGYQHVVAATLEVKPNEADTVYDATLVFMYEQYDGELHRFMNSLEYFVNVFAPSRIGV